MTPRLAIALCAVVVGVASLSLCQPPTPRVTKGEAPASPFITPTDLMSKDLLPAFDRVKQVVQVHNLDDLPSLDLMR